MFEIENGVLLSCDDDSCHLVIPNTVRKIGERAFVCADFESVTIPNTVTEIGAKAFELCTKLKTVYFPKSVQKIGSYAFYRCSALQEVVLPEGLTIIEEGCFCDCKMLSSIKLPTALCVINRYAFRNCEALQHLELPAGVSSIGADCFCHCKSLSSIMLPNSLNTIEPYAFRFCSALEKIELPYGITTVAMGSFSSCSALSTVALPESLLVIESEAFSFCFALEKIVLPTSLKYIEEKSFDSCKNLTTVYISENLEDCTNAFFECNKLVNFEEVENSKYLSIRNNALCSKDGSKLIRCNPNVVGKYTAPDCVHEIAPYAFYSLEKLTEINLPKCCIVGKDAFSRCWNLTKVNGFIIVGDNLVDYSGEDSVVTIPANIKHIGERAFCACESLQEIILPKGLIGIGDYAFAACTSLKRIEIPCYVESLGDFSFSGCSNLEYISVPGAVKIIPENCFSDCQSLKKIDLHEGLIHIKNDAFCGCKSLHELKIPYGTQRLGKIVDCDDSLSRIYIPETVMEIDEIALLINNLELYVQRGSFAKRFAQQNADVYNYTIVDVPASTFGAKETKPNPFVVDKGNLLAFLGESATTAMIPNCVETIGTNSFTNSEIKRIVIPENVTKIEPYAFYSCKHLEEVIICSKSITIEDSAFASCFDLKRIIIFSLNVNLSEIIFRTPFMDSVFENDHFCFYCPSNSPVIQYALRKKKNYAIIEADLAKSNIDQLISICNNRPVVPASAILIQEDTLIECCWTKLQKNCTLKLPDFIAHIAEGAFKDSGHIDEIILPQGLRTIGSETFMRSSVKKIVIPTTVEQIGEAAFCESSIREIVLSKIQELPPHIFSRCFALESVRLPNSLLKIGERAFDQCHSLMYITIPDSVVEIANDAFDGCFDCVYFCNPDSVARDYLEKHHLPAYTYSDEIVANIQKREILKVNNKNLIFNYQGCTIAVPSNYAIYYKLSKYYTPKADEIFGKLIKLCEKLVHDAPSSISEQFFSVLENLADTADRDLQSVGIYLQNAKERLYYTNSALKSMYPVMMSIFDAVLELYQNTISEMELKRDILLAQAESQVTGIGYSIITSSSITYAAHAFDDYFERVKQRKSAAQQLKIELDNMTEGKRQELDVLCSCLVEHTVKPTMKALIDQFVQELLETLTFYLELYELLPKNTQNMYDNDKANKLLTSDLSSSYHKNVILAKALAYCPYNLDVYYHIIDLGFANDTVYQIAAAVGIDQEVTALKGKISTEKEQRRIIEEQRKQEEERQRRIIEEQRKLEEKRRRERLIAEQQQREAEERERARAEKKRQIETEINSLQDELANLKGFFTGKRKAAIQQKIEELQNTLKKV